MSSLHKNLIHLILSTTKKYMDTTVSAGPEFQQQDSLTFIISSFQLIQWTSIIQFLFHLPRNNSHNHQFIHIKFIHISFTNFSIFILIHIDWKILKHTRIDYALTLIFVISFFFPYTPSFPLLLSPSCLLSCSPYIHQITLC